MVVSYEILLNHSLWDEEDIKQVAKDLHQLEVNLSVSHTEFAQAMGKDGYPVIHMEVPVDPLIFEDFVPLSVNVFPVVTHRSSGARAGLKWMELLVSLTVVFSICLFVPVPCVTKYLKGSQDYDVKQPEKH